MDEIEVLIQLRDILAYLYSDVASIQRVAQEARLNQDRINFNNPVKNVWHAVLQEAQKQAQVEEIIGIARKEYDKNPHLEAAWKNYQVATSKNFASASLESLVSTRQGRYLTISWFIIVLIATTLIIFLLLIIFEPSLKRTFAPGKQPTALIETSVTPTAVAAMVTTVASATLEASTFTPLPTAASTATATPTPDVAATQTELANILATAVAATLTAQPTPSPTLTPTPNFAATQTSEGQASATTLAALTTPSAPPAQPTATLPQDDNSTIHWVSNNIQACQGNGVMVMKTPYASSGYCLQSINRAVSFTSGDMPNLFKEGVAGVTVWLGLRVGCTWTMSDQSGTHVTKWTETPMTGTIANPATITVTCP